MIRIQINIVGIVTDADELEEIMDITELFAIEKRMMELKQPLNSIHIVKKTSLKTKINKFLDYNNNHLKILTVHGLN